MEEAAILPGKHEMTALESATIIVWTSNHVVAGQVTKNRPLPTPGGRNSARFAVGEFRQDVGPSPRTSGR